MSSEILVISGMSGAGKSSALRAFEDVGYYCVDNLPPQLMHTFIDLSLRKGAQVERVALAVDARTASFLDDFEASWERLRLGGTPCRLLFFDASDKTLLQRFSETRRPHPVEAEGGVSASIAAERALLAPIRELADEVIDTSEFNVRTLREFLLRHFDARSETVPKITVASFGFRHGVPQNADLILDVRFLPNPHYDPVLRPQTGLDTPVRQFVESQPATQEFLGHVDNLLSFLLPQYVAEGKTYLTVAFGCTGGRHRSVAMAGMVNEMLTEKGYSTTVTHIDLEGPGRRERR